MSDVDRLGAAVVLLLICLGVFFCIDGDPTSWALGCVAGFAIGAWYGLGRHSA
jgi:hypothetical protein